MHIHPSSPNSSLPFETEESAVIKIQAGFRGYRVRQQLHLKNKQHLKKDKVNLQEKNRSHQQQIMEETSKNKNDKSILFQDSKINESIDNDIENRSATKIQAGIRGFLVRKQQKLAADAATKIQAGFRGFKARKETQILKRK